jgi:lipoyl(octanoyl) transferase
MESIDINWITENMNGPEIPVLDAGTVKYDEAFDIQSELASKIIEEDYKGIILLLEHPPVITIGSNRSRDNLISTERKLKESGIELISSNRGGDITLHAPGQIICYPVLNLKYLKKDLTTFVYNLEQVIINTLEIYGIEGKRVKKHRGVFIKNSKIASIGLRVRKWVSIHGFSLNVDIDLSYFQHIIACGLKDFPQVSMSSLLEKYIAIDDVKEQIIMNLESVFGIKTVKIVLPG